MPLKAGLSFKNLAVLLVDVLLKARVLKPQLVHLLQEEVVVLHTDQGQWVLWPWLLSLEDLVNDLLLTNISK